MKNYSIDRILSSNISKMGLSEKTYDLISKTNGVIKLEKVSDIASLTRTELLSVLVDSGFDYNAISSAVEEVEEVLNSNGIELGDARAFMLQTKQNRDESAKGIRLSDISNNSKLVNKLARHGIYTLGDFSQHYISDVKDWITIYQKEDFDAIVENVKNYGLSFKQKEYFTKFEEPKIPYVNVNKLSQQDAEIFFDSPLEDIGLSKLTIERLAEKDVYTVGDLSSLYAYELRNALHGNDHLTDMVKERLSKYNIKIEYIVDKLYFQEPKIEPKEISEMTVMEKQEFYSRPLSDIGISKRAEEILQSKGIKTIGDVEELSSKQFRNVLKALNFTTAHKILNKLALFGVDKREKLLDRKFKEQTKEKVDFEKLSEKERDLYLNSSIVGMGFSDDIVAKFKSIGVETVGDLSQLTMKDIRAMVNNSPFTQSKIRQIFDDYGIEPVKLSTYIVEPKITPFDFNSADKNKQKEFMSRTFEDIGFIGVLAETLKASDIKTIGELVRLTGKDLREIYGAKRYTFKKLKDRLLEYGIELKEDVEKKVKTNLIESADIQSMSDEDKKAFLSKSIDEFKLEGSTQRKLKESGIETLGQLLDIEKPELRGKLKANNVVMNEIELLINNLGERMKGSLCYLVDGKLVYKSKDINNIKYPKKIESVDINTLSQDDREKFLDTKLEDLGLHVRAIDLIHKKSDIRTIRDIKTLYLGELNLLLAQNPEYIEETLSVLAECGITFEPKPNNGTKGRTFKKELSKLKKCETQEEVLALSLTDIGISSKVAMKLKYELGIETVEDLTKVSRNRINYLDDGNGRYMSGVCSSALKNIGLTLKESEKKYSQLSAIAIDPVDVNTLSEDELLSFSNRSLEEFGLSKKVTRIFVKEKNVKTIGEFLSISPLHVYSMLNGNDHLYTKACERMKEFGIEMPDYKTVKRARRKGGLPTTSRDESQEDKYFMRKMAHYDNYLSYMERKAHNKNQYLKDFEQNNKI